MKRKLISSALVAILLTSTLAASCGSRTTTHKLAIYTAQADAALLAVVNSLITLNEAGRLNANATKSALTFADKVNGAVATLRSRAEKGFDKKEALVIVQNLLDDLSQLEQSGVIGLPANQSAKFREVIFYARFTLNSIQAIIQAVKEPAPPTEGQVFAAARGRGAIADDPTFTAIVLHLQTAVLRGLAQSRMTQEEAFADGKVLSAETKTKIAAKLAAL